MVQYCIQGRREMSPALLYIFYITYILHQYYVRLTDNDLSQTRTQTHTHMHARRLTHTRNQLRYCRIVCVCVCARILYCVPAGLSGNYLFTQIDHNYGYYRGVGRRGHLTPSNPARRRRQIKSARARLHTHTLAFTHRKTIENGGGGGGTSSQFRT